ncbi:MAG TPA: T9SS type A sorting domain-containing protein, partial [Candidatus Kapabacteria bacterium]
YLEPVSSGVVPASSTQTTLLCYPNPATTLLSIENSIGTLLITDPLGRAYSVPRNGNTLDVSLLPAGIYFIVDGGSTTGTPHSAKFVKE